MKAPLRLGGIVAALTFLLGLLFAVTLEAEHAATTGTSTWLPMVAGSPGATVALYENLAVVVGFVLSPVLVALAGFLVGRRVDLSSEYPAVLGSLVVASAVGYGLGRLLAVLWLGGTIDGSLSVAGVVGLWLPAVVFAVSRTVLFGFAGVALGTVTSRRSARGRIHVAPSDARRA